MACTGIHVVDPICQAGNIAGSATDDAFSRMARSFGDSAASATQWLWKQINEATSINLASPGLAHDLLATGAIALILCLGLFLVQVIMSALRREPAGLMRGLRGLGIATIASTFAIATTRVALAAVDGLCNGLVQFATGGGIDTLGAKYGIAAGLAGMTNAAGLLLFSLAVLAAVVMIWVAMMARKMLILVAAVMAPLAFAGGAADLTRSWVRRWIEFTAALVASKLLLIVMLIVGLSVFEGAGLTQPAHGHPTVTQSATQLATGTVLLLLAGLAPWAAIKMVHFAGDSLHTVHQQAQAAHAGTRAAVAAPRKVSSAMGQGKALRGTVAAGSGPPAKHAAGVVAPVRSAGRPPDGPGAAGGGSASPGAASANSGRGSGISSAARMGAASAGPAGLAATTAHRAAQLPTKIAELAAPRQPGRPATDTN